MPLLSNKCPCRGCVAPKRHLGCHGHCKEYKDWDNARHQLITTLRELDQLEKDYQVARRKKKPRDKRR